MFLVHFFSELKTAKNCFLPTAKSDKLPCNRHAYSSERSRCSALFGRTARLIFFFLDSGSSSSHYVRFTYFEIHSRQCIGFTARSSAVSRAQRKRNENRGNVYARQLLKSTVGTLCILLIGRQKLRGLTSPRRTE